MFLGNLISNIIGGVFVGLISDKPSHVFVFSFLWVFVSYINLFTFQKKDLTRFEMLIRVQEIKHNNKTNLNPKRVWIIIYGLAAFLISFVIGLVIVVIKR